MERPVETNDLDVGITVLVQASAVLVSTVAGVEPAPRSTLFADVDEPQELVMGVRGRLSGPTGIGATLLMVENGFNVLLSGPTGVGALFIESGSVPSGDAGSLHVAVGGFDMGDDDEGVIEVAMSVGGEYVNSGGASELVVALEVSLSS